MEVTGQNAKMQRMLNSEQSIKKAYGADHARIILRRIAELKAAENMEQLKFLPHLKFHQLIGNRKKQWAIKIDKNYRMILRLPEGCNAFSDSEGIDLSAITTVVIENPCVDYH